MADQIVANIKVVSVDGIDWGYRLEYRNDGADESSEPSFFAVGTSIPYALRDLAQKMIVDSYREMQRSPLTPHFSGGKDSG